MHNPFGASLLRIFFFFFSLSLYLIIIAHSFVPSPISRSAVLLSPLPPSLQENEMALLHLNLEGFMTGLVVICVQISPIYFV